MMSALFAQLERFVEWHLIYTNVIVPLCICCHCAIVYLLSLCHCVFVVIVPFVITNIVSARAQMFHPKMNR